MCYETRGSGGEMAREVTWDQFSPDKGTEQSSGDKLDNAGPCFSVGDTTNVEWVDNRYEEARLARPGLARPGPAWPAGLVIGLWSPLLAGPAAV